jgi:hypothetical protein
MANDLTNTDLVVKYSVKAFLNALILGAKVDRQLDTKNVYSGKVGETVRVRRPVYFEATSGAVIESGQISNIEEGTIPVTLDRREKVVFPISSEEQTLNIEDVNERYIIPAMEELAQKVESAIAAEYKYIYNFVGTPGVAPSSFLNVAAAKAKLDVLGVPFRDRCAFYDPETSIVLADGLKAVFPEGIARKAIEEAAFGRYANFECYTNQSLKLHTVGINTGTPLVNGSDQNVTYEASKNTDTQVLNTDGWTNDQTGILKAGDVFTIAGVNSINRRTRENSGNLAQFVVTEDADSGSTTGPAALTISPPIIIDGAYQTVTAAPIDDAEITVLTGTGGQSYRQGLAFHPNAITLAMAQLDLPKDGVTSSRQNFKNVSLRLIRQYNSTLDHTIIRIDVFFGVKTQNAGFAVRTTS